MEFISNKDKKVEIEVEGKIYMRHAIQTHFITTKDNYIDVLKEYVLGIYQVGDILSISEKIISLCQNRIVRREDIKIRIASKSFITVCLPEKSWRIWCWNGDKYAICNK